MIHNKHLKQLKQKQKVKVAYTAARKRYRVTALTQTLTDMMDTHI